MWLRAHTTDLLQVRLKAALGAGDGITKIETKEQHWVRNNSPKERMLQDVKTVFSGIWSPDSDSGQLSESTVPRQLKTKPWISTQQAPGMP